MLHANGLPDFGKRACLLLSALLTFACTPEKPNGGDPVEECRKYDRDSFGYGDIDYDGDGCYARAELLISLSLAPVQMDPASRCRVARGKWVDAYSNDTLVDADSVEIDHVVALSEAHKSGAYDWPLRRRSEFGNRDSLGELVITKSSTNQGKGNLDIAGWSPSGQERKLQYARKWVRLKTAWGLVADPRERTAIKAILLGDTSALPMEAPEYSCP